MTTKIPKGWEYDKLGNFCSSIRGVSYKPENLKSTKSKQTVTLFRSNNIQELGINYEDVQFVDKDKVKPDQIMLDGDIAICMSNGSRKLVGKNSVFVDLQSSENFTVGAFCSIIRTNKNSTYHFIRHLLKSDAFVKQVEFSLSGSTINNLKDKNIEDYMFLFPPITEQNKIASFLTSVDNVIEKTHFKIKRLQDLKKSVMNDLMNKGIKHKEFKDTKLGKIPKTWNIYKYRDLLKIVDDKVEMRDDKFYPLLSIKRKNGGVFSRETLIGKKILTKTLGKAIVDTFIISKMQIIHGASGYISEKFKDHYVSSSYTQFAARDKNKINTKFLFYFSHLDKVYKEFLRSSHGVHIEKMTFDLKDWYNNEIILPGIKEQQKIVRIIESFENHIFDVEQKLKKYNFLKKSLLQNFLTGKVRLLI